MEIQEFFDKWTSTRPNLKVSFHDAGIEAMAFAEAYRSEQLRLHNVSQRSELLLFRKWQEDNWNDVYLYCDELMIETYLKSHCG